MSKRIAKTLSALALTLTSIITLTTGASAYERRERSEDNYRASKQMYRVDYVRGLCAAIRRVEGVRGYKGEAIESRYKAAGSIRRYDERTAIASINRIRAIRTIEDIYTVRSYGKVDSQYRVDRTEFRDRSVRLDRGQISERVGNYVDRGLLDDKSEITIRGRA